MSRADSEDDEPHTFTFREQLAKRALSGWDELNREFTESCWFYLGEWPSETLWATKKKKKVFTLVLVFFLVKETLDPHRKLKKEFRRVLVELKKRPVVRTVQKRSAASEKQSSFRIFRCGSP